MYILSTQNYYVYSIYKLRVISRSIYFMMTLTGFSNSLQVHVAVHVWFLNLSILSHIAAEKKVLETIQL